MIDYEKLYHAFFSDVENTINQLIRAQNDAEERYLKAGEDSQGVLCDYMGFQPPQRGEESRGG